MSLRAARTPTVGDCASPVREEEEDGIIYRRCDGKNGSVKTLSWKHAGGGKSRRRHRTNKRAHTRKTKKSRSRK